MNFTHLIDELSIYNKDKVVFVGLGNELRADDAAGIELVKRIKAKEVFKDSHFIIAGQNPENYLQTILNYDPDMVIFIDAAEWNGNPGEIKIFIDEEISQTEFSTHTFSIKMIKDYLLNQKQMNFMFIGIKPLQTKFEQALSEPIKKSIDKFFQNEI